MFTSTSLGGGSWCNFKFFGWNFDQKNFWVGKKSETNKRTNKQTNKRTNKQTNKRAQLPEPKEGLFFD